MARAAEKRATHDASVDEAALRGALDALYLEGAAAVAQPKLLGVVEQWTSRTGAIEDERAAATAIMLAMDLEMFAPSFSGSNAFDRLGRRGRLDGAKAAALAALEQARFTPLRVRSIEAETGFVAENLFTGSTITVLYDNVREAAVGLAVVARVVPLPSGTFAAFGPVTPLDEAGLAVALDFKRPGKAPNDHRCAAAVYRHVVRHGTPVVLGFNDFPDDGLEDADADESDGSLGLDAIAMAWLAMGGAEPSAEVADEVRASATSESVVETCFKCFATSSRKQTRDLAAAYRWILELQMETLQRRALARGTAASDPFDAIAAIMDHEIATRDYPAEAKALFLELRGSLARATSRQPDDELTRVIERIRALRAKTLDQGCTEAEAVAAAAKVAELLDRYGLTLSEIDIRKQTCEGIGIDSTRKRRTPLDDSLNAIADFCDCRAWQEITAGGTRRSIFFGLPADVEAAHYLYGRIEAALETETRTFQAGPLYGELRGGDRRVATTSFQVGVANGICTKLRALKAERDEARGSSGRDLVVVKHSAMDDEMAKLGLTFTLQEKRTRHVDVESFRQGQVAGHKFEARDSLR